MLDYILNGWRISTKLTAASATTAFELFGLLELQIGRTFLEPKDTISALGLDCLLEVVQVVGDPVTCQHWQEKGQREVRVFSFNDHRLEEDYSTIDDASKDSEKGIVLSHKSILDSWVYFLWVWFRTQIVVGSWRLLIQIFIHVGFIVSKVSGMILKNSKILFTFFLKILSTTLTSCRIFFHQVLQIIII